jgi:hypothetical protein
MADPFASYLKPGNACGSRPGTVKPSVEAASLTRHDFALNPR